MSEHPASEPANRPLWRRLLSPWMLLAVIAVGILTWVGVQVQRRRAERDALAQLKSVEDGRSFNIQFGNPLDRDQPSRDELLFVGGPDWLTNWLGVDLCRTVTFFQCYAPGNTFSYGSDDTGNLVISRTYRSGIGGHETQLLAAFANLTRLDLEAHPVGDEIGPVLKHLPRLESLNLANTAITDDALSNIAQLKRLRSLNVANTDVTDEGIDHLAGLSALEILNVAMTNVSDERIERLRQEFPQCQIQR